MWPCVGKTQEQQNNKNDWLESQLLHRQFLSQPPGQKGLLLSLPHTATQLAYRLLHPLYLLPLVKRLPWSGWRDELCMYWRNWRWWGAHSRNCSWVLETILIKSLHSSCNTTCWNTNSFGDQWLLKKHSEQRSAYGLLLSSLPVLLFPQQRGDLRENEDVSAFHMEIRQCILQLKERTWIYMIILQWLKTLGAWFSIISSMI